MSIVKSWNGTERLADLDDVWSGYIDNYIATQASALPVKLPSEYWETGGHCTVAISTDGLVDVNLLTMDGFYGFCVFVADDDSDNPEIAERHGWYYDAMVYEWNFTEEELTLDEAAGILAGLVEVFIQEEKPIRLDREGAWKQMSNFGYHESIDEHYFATVQEALDYASDIQNWVVEDWTDLDSGDDEPYKTPVEQIRIMDERTGSDLGITLKSQESAAALFMESVGRC